MRSDEGKNECYEVGSRLYRPKLPPGRLGINWTQIDILDAPTPCMINGEYASD